MNSTESQKLKLSDLDEEENNRLKDKENYYSNN